LGPDAEIHRVNFGEWDAEPDIASKSLNLVVTGVDKWGARSPLVKFIGAANPLIREIGRCLRNSDGPVAAARIDVNSQGVATAEGVCLRNGPSYGESVGAGITRAQRDISG